MRSIIHLDADAFFASVEQSADARLRGKPIAVGGEKRGIIASASYEARKFGIYTPMPTSLARRLCPKLVLLPGDFEKYELFSRLMFSYAYDFTPDVEIGSIDEGYFDLTGVRKPAVDIAHTIRGAIRQALRLSVSEGIAANKLVSQIASKLKKPAAFQLVPSGGEAAFLCPLPNQWLPGVGPKTAGQLTAAGLARIGQIAQTPPDLLGLLVGRMAPQLRNFALGIDERPVIPASAPAKSYGEQETFPADTTDEEFIHATLRRMADHLMAKVRADAKSIRTLTVKVRYNDMDEEQAGESLFEPTDLETELYSRLSMLLRKAWKRRVSLRLVSLKLSNIYDGRFGAGLLLDPSARRHDAQQRLADVVDGLRQKYGRAILLRGHDFILRHKEPERDLSQTRSLSPRSSLGSNGQCPAFRISNSSSRTSDFYLPLRLHSYYSFLDSTLSIPAIIDLAKRSHLPALALTDTGNLHGAVEFAQAAIQAGIKPIIGVELTRHGSPLCLYVQNQAGYHNLCRLLSRETDETWPSPILSPSSTAGLLAVSPNPSLASLFPDRFYLAIDNPDAAPDSLPRPSNAQTAHLPTVASLPIHYALPADRWKYDVVQSIRTLTLLRQPHPAKCLDGQYHFRTLAEMRQLFDAQPALLARTREIADRCSFAFTLGKPQFPNYPTPDGSPPGLFLRRLVMAGLQRRYPKNHARIKPQLEQELSIITEVGYEEYFLVVWDILQECRRRGIDWITRGSAADSLACYCLDISNVCPIRFDLYFRRFLNKDRMALHKLPDIDVDFPHDRKDDVIKLIFEKFGPEHTAIVGGFSTFQSRSAFAEVAKVLGVSDFQARRITERLPWFSHAADLAEITAASLECRDLPLDQEPYSTALEMARFLDGFPRYPKMHPCGLVLSRQPMHQLTPCFTSAKGYPTTHFDMDSIEAIGLVKMDILAQGGLAVIRDVLETLGSGADQVLSPREVSGGNPPHPGPLPLGEGRGEGDSSAATPPESCLPSPSGPFADPAVWALISSGQARAVHHIESPAMISLCKMCNVRDIDTLIAIVSVIRPGAANESKKMEFARRYQGLSPIRYPHPSLESCLRSTYGLVVYEEHILQICEAFAGLPPGRADILRRALGKENTAIISQIQLEFAACARKHGRTETEIAEVWELVAGFRGYAFCKAHSTAYGVEAYQSAWLKLHYPAEFMAAVLTNGKGFYSPLVYILECHRLGIPLLPPSVNEPGPQFKVVRTPKDAIRVPLLRLKGLTEHTAAAIIPEHALRPFASLTDFLHRVQPLPEEMEALIRAGAFDSFGQSRTAQYWEYKGSACARRLSGLNRGSETKGHTPLFGDWLSAIGDSTQAGMLPRQNLKVPLSEPSRLDRLRAEEELLGYPVSGHPLELFPDIAWNTYCPINRLGDHLDEQIVTCGLVIEQRLFHQATGEPMKFITITDWTGSIETELFAQTYKSYGLSTIRYRVLEVTATVEPFENRRGHTLRVLRAGKPRTRICSD
jgi:DNA-directed DNA polymerase III PolC